MTHKVIATLSVIVTSGALLLSSAACGQGSPAEPAAPSAQAGQAVADARAKQDGRIRFLEERATRDPLDVFSLNSLAREHMQRARETGDVSELARAEDALNRSLGIRLNDNYEGIVLLASVSATKHDFARALYLAKAAIPLKPREAFGYGVLGDAYMGLGRYEDADFAYQKMVDIEPDLPAFGRRALLFQNRGMTDEAEGSWKAALQRSEGDGVPEHSAWARAQLANLYFMIGRIDDAGMQYQASLDAFPKYVHALAGLGRVAAANGDLTGAADNYTSAIEAVPLPEYVIALGDVYASAGDSRSADAQYALVGAIEQLYAANGVNLDLQIGMFNADHDRNVALTVARAQAAYAEQPSIQAADVLAWVQYKAGEIDEAMSVIEQALRTGTRDPLILFHAGMIYRRAGNAAKAKAYLAAVEGQNPQFSILQAPVARDALRELTGAARAPGS